MSEASIVTIVSGTVTVATMAFGFLTLWVKLRYGVRQAEEAAEEAALAKAQASVVERKIDHNTTITAAAAALASDATADLARQLNGQLDERIARVVQEQVAPAFEALDKRHAEAQARFKELTDYQHKVKHDLADGLHALNLKVERILQAIEAKK